MIVTSKLYQLANENNSLHTLACGTPTFTNEIRQGVLESIDNVPIEFAETEFRPAGFRKGREQCETAIQLRPLQKAITTETTV